MKSSLEFVFSAKVREIFDNFTSLFGIRIAYFGPDGKELEVGLDRPWCEYCLLLRHSLGDEAVCRDSDAERRNQAAISRNLVSYRCHGGLDEAIKPLYLDSSLIGFIMIGQARTESGPPPDKMRRWAGARGDDRLHAAFADLPLHTTTEFSQILVLFSALVDLIVACHLIEIRGRGRIDFLIDRLKLNCAESLSLGDAASLLGLSPGRLAHLLKESSGKSFKEIQTEIRLEKAEELLGARPEIPIKELAFLCGYQDPLYFSRLYRRHRGRSPTESRAAMASGIEGELVTDARAVGAKRPSP